MTNPRPYEHLEACDVLLDYRTEQQELTPAQQGIFAEAAEQIAAYQCHPETQFAIAQIAVSAMTEAAPKVIYLNVPRNVIGQSVVNQ